MFQKSSFTERCNSSGWSFLFLIFLAFCITQYIFHIRLGLIYTDTGIFTFILALLGISFITLLSMQLAKMKITILETLGSLSMVIYLLHILSGSGARIILSKILHIQNWWIHITSGTIIGIFSPVIIYFIAKRCNINFLFSYPRKINK
jgi:peptidoglycan/LPS O-acetylase OafA/YrhL